MKVGMITPREFVEGKQSWGLTEGICKALERCKDMSDFYRSAKPQNAYEEGFYAGRAQSYEDMGAVLEGILNGNKQQDKW